MSINSVLLQISASMLHLPNHLVSIKCLMKQLGNILFWSYHSVECYKTAIMTLIVYVELGLSTK
jgi:hypothetical protein